MTHETPDQATRMSPFRLHGLPREELLGIGRGVLLARDQALETWKARGNGADSAQDYLRRDVATRLLNLFIDDLRSEFQREPDMGLDLLQSSVREWSDPLDAEMAVMAAEGIVQIDRPEVSRNHLDLVFEILLDLDEGGREGMARESGVIQQAGNALQRMAEAGLLTQDMRARRHP